MNSIRLNRLILLWLAACGLIIAIGESLAAAHGLDRTFAGADGYVRRGNWLWPTLDGGDYSRQDADNVTRDVTFGGYLWQGSPGQGVWRVVYNGDLTIRVDRKVIFQGSQDGALTTVEIPLSWSQDFLRLDIDYKPIYRWGIGSDRPEMGIYEMGPWGGWRLLPTWRLYPQAPDTHIARAEVVRATVVSAGWAILLVSCLLLAARWIWRSRLWAKPEVWIIAGLIAVAAVARGIVLLDRANGDNLFYFVIPGRDNYVEWSREWLSGQYSLIGAYAPPGMVLWNGAIQHLFGPHFWPLYIVHTGFGAFSVGAAAGAAWIAFGKRAGIAAGLLAALYPQLVFFQTTSGADGLFASFTAFAALAAAWCAKSPALRRAVLFGVVVGMTGLIKPIALVFCPAMFVSLAITRDRMGVWRGWRRVLELAFAMAVAALVVVGPLPVLDKLSGQSLTFSNYGSNTLYIGNNRQADGSNVSQAVLLRGLRGSNGFEAALSDIRADPAREFWLMLHKIGLFWSNLGSPDLYDYTGQGLELSGLLEVLSLRRTLGMTFLAALTFSGLAYLMLDPDQRRRNFAWALISMIGFIVAALVAFHVTERFRIMIVPLLCVAAAVTIDQLIGVVQTRRMALPLAQAGGVSALLLLSFGFEQVLPPKTFYQGDLPASMIPSGVTFGSNLKLLGVLPVEVDYRPVSRQTSAYILVTAYWEAVGPLPEDYKVSAQAVDRSGNLVAATDVVLGSIVYPTVGTSKWFPGARLREEYLIRLPRRGLPSVVDVNLIVYSQASVQRLPVLAPDGDSAEQKQVKIASTGLIVPEGLPTLTGDVEDANIQLGDALRVTGLRVPRRVTRPSDLTVGIRWEAAGRINEDYVVFFHLLDPANRMIAQSDDVILTGEWTTSALIPGMALGGERQLKLPPDMPPGHYHLVMGAYHFPSLDRLPAMGADGAVFQDGLIDLGWIEVR